MYKSIFSLSIKNILLRKTRAFLLVLMIASSMSFMLTLEGLYDGITKNVIDMTLRSDTGELSIYAKEYRLKQDIKYRIDDARRIHEMLQDNPSVESSVIRFKLSGLGASATKSYPVDLIGVDLKEEQVFGRFSEFIKEGELNLGENGCVVGKELAKDLKLRLNSRVVFTTQDVNKTIQSKLFRVKAIIQTININIDKKALFAPLESVIHFAGVPVSSATQIAIRTKDKALQENIKVNYPHLEVLNLSEINPMLTQMQDMTVIFNSISFSIVMGVVFIGIVGVMYVSILERIREFGIMLCIGYGYRYIQIQVIFEALFLAFSGFILGTVFSLLSLYYFSSHGLDLSEFSDGLQSFGMSSVIYADLKVGYFVRTFNAILFASILSVFLPLRTIKRLNPIDVVKGES